MVCLDGLQASLSSGSLYLTLSKMSNHPWNASLLDSLTGGLTPVQAAALALQTGSANNVYLNMFASSAVQSLGTSGDNASTPSAVDAALTALLLAHAPPATAAGPLPPVLASYGASPPSSSMPLLQPARATGMHSSDANSYASMHSVPASQTAHTAGASTGTGTGPYAEQGVWQVPGVASNGYHSYSTLQPPLDSRALPSTYGTGIPPSRIRAPLHAQYAHTEQLGAVSSHLTQQAALYTDHTNTVADPWRNANTLQHHEQMMQAPGDASGTGAGKKSRGRKPPVQKHSAALDAVADNQHTSDAGSASGRIQTQDSSVAAMTEGVTAAGSVSRVSGRKRKVRSMDAADEEEELAAAGYRPSASGKKQHARQDGVAEAAASGVSARPGEAEHAEETVTSENFAPAGGSASKKGSKKSAMRASAATLASVSTHAPGNAALLGAVLGADNLNEHTTSTSAINADLRVHKEGPASLHNKKKAWTAEEDDTLRAVVSKLEEETRESGKPIPWAKVDKHNLLPGRNSKQCRDRWVQHLKGDILKAAWTEEEDLLLYQQIQIHGTHWSEIQKSFPGRTDHDIKNHFYATKRRLARRQQRERLDAGDAGDQEGEEEG